MNSDWRSRRDRVREVLEELNIDKSKFCERLSVSEAQYYRWVRSDVDSNHAAIPSVTVLSKFCAEFDVSPTYILFGVGLKWMNEIETFTHVSEALTFNKQMMTEVVLPFIEQAKKHMEEMKAVQ